MRADNRGRVRFGHKGYRAEVGQSGSVNLTFRSRMWGEERAGNDDYKHMMNDPVFIEKLFKAQTEARRAGVRRMLWAQPKDSMGTLL